MQTFELENKAALVFLVRLNKGYKTANTFFIQISGIEQKLQKLYKMVREKIMQ